MQITSCWAYNPYFNFKGSSCVYDQADRDINLTRSNQIVSLRILPMLTSENCGAFINILNQLPAVQGAMWIELVLFFIKENNVDKANLLIEIFSKLKTDELSHFSTILVGLEDAQVRALMMMLLYENESSVLVNSIASDLSKLSKEQVVALATHLLKLLTDDMNGYLNFVENLERAPLTEVLQSIQQTPSLPNNPAQTSTGPMKEVSIRNNWEISEEIRKQVFEHFQQHPNKYLKKVAEIFKISKSSALRIKKNIFATGTPILNSTEQEIIRRYNAWYNMEPLRLSYKKFISEICQDFQDTTKNKVRIMLNFYRRYMGHKTLRGAVSLASLKQKVITYYQKNPSLSLTEIARVCEATEPSTRKWTREFKFSKGEGVFSPKEWEIINSHNSFPCSQNFFKEMKKKNPLRNSVQEAYTVIRLYKLSMGFIHLSNTGCVE